ncbi:MAG: hypothetical protein EDM75_01715 [Chlorobiota bacterium]|nr:MAG: hypothetical protein EDM75_01715 [Chlorobiota bacterium]
MPAYRRLGFLLLSAILLNINILAPHLHHHVEVPEHDDHFHSHILSLLQGNSHADHENDDHSDFHHQQHTITGDPYKIVARIILIQTLTQVVFIRTLPETDEQIAVLSSARSLEIPPPLLREGIIFYSANSSPPPVV